MLWARLTQPGRNGGWISGNLSWGKLDYLYPHLGYSADQVRLLRELYAVCRSAARRDPLQLLLRTSGHRVFRVRVAAAVAAAGPRRHRPGCSLRYGGKRGALDPFVQAELCLDATRDEAGALSITPSLLVDGVAGARPLTFIGPTGTASSMPIQPTA